MNSLLFPDGFDQLLAPVHLNLMYLPHEMVTVNGSFVSLTLAECKKATPRGGYIPGWEYQDIIDILLVNGQTITIDLSVEENEGLVFNLISNLVDLKELRKVS